MASLYHIYVQRGELFKNEKLKDVFMSNLYKIKDNFFERIIDIMTNTAPDYTDEIKKILTPELESKLKKNNLINKFVKQDVADITFDTSGLIRQLLEFREDIKVTFEQYRNTHFTELTLEEFKEAFLRQQHDTKQDRVMLNSLRYRIYWVSKLYSFFDEDVRILKFLESIRGDSQLVIVFVSLLNKDFYSEQQIIDA